LKNKGYKVCLKNWNAKNIWVQSQFLYDTKNIFLDYKDLRMEQKSEKINSYNYLIWKDIFIWKDIWAA
jgi:hypothetical protein